MSEDETDHQVGYGRPPRHTRFRKGQSGNPSGRRRGARGVKTLLDEALAQTVMVSEGGLRTEVSKREALLLSLINGALKGDMRATAQVLRLMQDTAGGPQGEKELTIHVVDGFDDPA